MLLKAMIKEEWRMHSTLFGGRLFALFPVVLLFFSLLGGLFLPVFIRIFPARELAAMAHYVFLLFGASVGGFGLFGREAMNRRFGQASLIAYSSRTLPISERSIFLDFFVKDMLFYFILWVIPIASGFSLASLYLSLGLPLTLLAASLTLSFLLGLSAIFLLSTIYVHSGKILVLLLALSGVALLSGFPLSLPSLSFFLNPSPGPLLFSLFLVVASSSVSILFMKTDYPRKKRHLSEKLSRLSPFFGGQGHFMAKDLLDLHRSEGGMGKIIFSYLFPLLILWFLLSILMRFLPGSNFLVLFSLFLGIISSSVYNWLTEFDLFSSYSFLPVRVSSVVKSKLSSYSLINLLSILILLAAALVSGQAFFLLPALMTLVSVSAYALAVTLYLTGLYPNVLLYNAKNFALYIAMISPVLLALMFLSVWSPFLLALSPFPLLPLSAYLVKKALNKWDTWQGPVF